MDVDVNVTAAEVKYVNVTIKLTSQQWDDYLRPLLEAGRQHVKFDESQRKQNAISFAANLISATDRAVYNAKEDY